MDSPVEVATIRVPLAEPIDTQAMRIGASHIEVRLGEYPEARQGAMRLLAGLDACGARLQSGRRVVNYADAVRWALEQLTAGAEVK
jgi:hypothetical protein